MTVMMCGHLHVGVAIWILAVFAIHFRSLVQSGSNPSGEVEVILDSGSDVSILPEAWSSIGTQGKMPPLQYRDAQGNPIKITASREAYVTLGDTSFREVFAIGPVTCPILSFGKLVKAGWSLTKASGKHMLAHGDKRISVGFKKNSLVTSGTIRAVMETGDAELEQSIRRVVLGDVLSAVGPEWVQIADGCFAVKCKTDAFLDVSMCMPNENIRMRTTLIMNKDGHWDVLEYAQPIAELADQQAPFSERGESLSTVLTIAYRQNVPAHRLGFTVDSETETGSSRDVPITSDEPSSARPSEEKKVGFELADESGEQNSGPVDEQQHVPAPLSLDSELAQKDTVPGQPVVAEVKIDEVVLTVDSTVKVLREACKAWGLGMSGGKKLLFGRLVEHDKKVRLHQSRELALQSKPDEREVVEVPRVAEPTPEQVAQHSATHLP